MMHEAPTKKLQKKEERRGARKREGGEKNLRGGKMPFVVRES